MGATIVSASQIPPKGDRFNAIRTQIGQSTLVVSYTEENQPGALYELGIAHALSKPVLVLTRSGWSGFAEVSNSRLFVFDDAADEQVQARLISVLKEALAHPQSMAPDEVAIERESKTKVFISYSHRDVDYLSRLLVHLRPLEKQGLIDPWADTRLAPGDKWKDEIDRALTAANVALLLVSADFLASDFITDNELPPLLQRAEQQGTRIIPVVLKPCRFTRDTNLRQFQSINDPARPLALLTPVEQEIVYDKVASEIERWQSRG